MERGGDVSFSVDSLFGSLPSLMERGVTELHVHDEPFSRDRVRMMRLFSELSELEEPPFVSVLADASAVDAGLASAAGSSLSSLEIPLCGTVRNGTLLFDRRLYARKAALLNDAGAVFGFIMEWGRQEGDRAKLFRERLDFAVEQYPNHVDFPQLSGEAQEKGTAVFSSRDMELCRESAFACQTFYSEGRAVPWFRTVLEPLRIRPSSFFSDFAEWQRCNNCGVSSSFSPFSAPHADIEKMQTVFVREKYEEKRLFMLIDAACDMIRLNGAFSRVVAEHEDCEIELSYSPDDLLSPAAMSLESFCDNVPMEKCRVRVYDAGEAPDYRIL